MAHLGIDSGECKAIPEIWQDAKAGSEVGQAALIHFQFSQWCWSRKVINTFRKSKKGPRVIVDPGPFFLGQSILKHTVKSAWEHSSFNGL